MPVIVWMIVYGWLITALWVCLAAGLSDAVDGFLAKRLACRTQLGVYLDPIADKVLLVSLFLTFGVQGLLPSWLVILVVFRDLLIVGGALLTHTFNLNPTSVAPMKVGKLNTLLQIVLSVEVLARAAYGFADHGIDDLLIYAVAADHPGLGRRLRAALGSRRASAGKAAGMNGRQKWWIWLLGAAAFVAFVFLFETILLPFVAGLAIAYLLDPLADRFEAWRIPRGLSALFVLVIFAIVMIAGVLLIVPLLQGQIVELVRRMPEYLTALQKRVLELAELAQTQLKPEDVERLRGALTEQAGTAFAWLGTVLRGLVGGSLALFNLLTLLFVTPIVAFYMLRDWDRLVAQMDRLLPLEHRETIRTQVRVVDATLAGYVRGQATVCVVLGLLYATGLWLAGLDFGFTLGLLSGLVSFIPYVGSIFGLVTSVGLALIQFDEFSRVLIVAAIFVVGQVIEGNFLTPKLVGERVNLHPVWVIFALFAGGVLAGFVGLLLALPVAAVIGVLIRFATHNYLASSFYRGDKPAAVDGAPACRGFP